jgi:hypothetical protein
MNVVFELQWQDLPRFGLNPASNLVVVGVVQD